MLIQSFSRTASDLADLSLLKRAWLLALSGWAVYFVYSVIHCLLYLSYVEKTPRGVWDSLVWTLSENSLWPALTAMLFIALSQCWPRKLYTAMAGLCFAAFIIALGGRVLLDFALNPDAEISSSVVYFGSKHLTVMVMVTLVWALILRPLDGLNASQLRTEPASAKPLNQVAAAPTEQSERHETLTVNTGTREVTVPIANIDSVTASGNYMDITCGAQNYVLRSTLKELEGQLRGHGFARVHRSHLVNLDAVTQIDNNQQVILRNGQRFSIGQRYLKNVVNYQKTTSSVTLSL
ncbi:MAG TPA: LytTR family DNA-binding domain-containing protein [Marinagarivorans sp.]